MTRHSIVLDEWNWHCVFFYDADWLFADEVALELECLSAPDELTDEIFECVRTCRDDYRIIISNYRSRESVVVIGTASSAAQFQNTYDHEKGHLAMHIADASGIEPLSEEFQYLAGTIGELTFPTARRYLCDC